MESRRCCQATVYCFLIWPPSLAEDTRAYIVSRWCNQQKKAIYAISPINITIWPWLMFSKLDSMAAPIVCTTKHTSLVNPRRPNESSRLVAPPQDQAAEKHVKGFGKEVDRDKDARYLHDVWWLVTRVEG